MARMPVPAESRPPAVAVGVSARRSRNSAGRRRAAGCGAPPLALARGPPVPLEPRRGSARHGGCRMTSTVARTMGGDAFLWDSGRGPMFSVPSRSPYALGMPLRPGTRRDVGATALAARSAHQGCGHSRVSGRAPGGIASRRRWQILHLLCAVPLSACNVGEYVAAHNAPEILTGLSANDLRLCAGLPDRTAAGTGGVEFWSYERSVSVGSGSISVPQVGLNLSGGGGEECRATFELAGGWVSRVAFTRVSGAPATALASCAPLVGGCVSMIRNGHLLRAAPPPAALPATAGQTPAPPGSRRF